MSGGFWGWVAGPGGTLALTIAALALGVVLGELDGVPRGRRRERVELRGRRVAGQFRRMRPPELHHEPRRMVPIESRPLRIEGLGTPIRHTGTEAAAMAAMIWSSPLNGVWPVAELARVEHEDQAMAVANGEDAVFLAGINERLDRWLADTFGTS